MLSQAEENYLKAIYNIGLRSEKSVSTNEIANYLQTKASSVTDMIKKLADKQFISYKKYQGASLMTDGKKLAVEIVRKHRLWEVFLVDKLNYSWDEVHDLAEQLEHIKSDTLIDRLDDFLNNPIHDPHGDPIPDKNGNIWQHKKIMLSSVDNDGTCMVTGVKDSSSAFLKILDVKNIKLGTVLEVLSREDLDNSLLVKNMESTVFISHSIAENLFVKII